MAIPPWWVQDLALWWWQAAGSQQVDGERGRTQEPEVTLGSVSPGRGSRIWGGFGATAMHGSGRFHLASVAPVTVGALVRFQSEQTVRVGRQVWAAVCNPGMRTCNPCVMLGPSEPCGMRYSGCGTWDVVPRVRYLGCDAWDAVSRDAVPRLWYLGCSTWDVMSGMQYSGMQYMGCGTRDAVPRVQYLGCGT